MAGKCPPARAEDFRSRPARPLGVELLLHQGRERTERPTYRVPTDSLGPYGRGWLKALVAPRV